MGRVSGRKSVEVFLYPSHRRSSAGEWGNDGVVTTLGVAGVLARARDYLSWEGKVSTSLLWYHGSSLNNNNYTDTFSPSTITLWSDHQSIFTNQCGPTMVATHLPWTSKAAPSLSTLPLTAKELYHLLHHLLVHIIIIISRVYLKRMDHNWS